MNASSWFEITAFLLVVYFTDYWFSLLLGCPLSWPQMGSICIMVLCLARDHRAHRWHRHTGTIFQLFYRLHGLIFLVNGNQSLIIYIYIFFNLVEKAYAGSQTLQSIILLCTGTHKDGGYLAPKWLFLCMYVGLTIIWAILNTFALEVIAFIDVISIWWQV